MSQPELIWALVIGGVTLLAMVVVAGLVERRDRRRKGPEPWIGYTYSSTDEPKPGRRYQVKSIQDGYVVLEKLEE